jgi:hypothetical protein
MNSTSIGYALIVLYLIGIVGLGIWAGFRRRKGGEGSRYFLHRCICCVVLYLSIKEEIIFSF